MADSKQSSVNSRVTFPGESAALLGPEESVSQQHSVNNTPNTTPGSSISKRGTRTRSNTLIAEQRDLEQQQWEAEASCCELYGKMLRLLPFIVLTGIAQVSVGPIVPGVMEDYFGSAKKAGEVTSYAVAASAFVGIFTASFYGKLLDTIGRKPFFVVMPIVQVFTPTLLLLLFNDNPVPYLIANSIGSLVQSSNMSSYIADHYSTKSRPRMFAVIQAMSALSTFGAVLAGALSHTILYAVACTLSALASLYAIFFIQESMPEHTKITMTCAIATQNPFGGLKLLWNSKVCRSVCVVIGCWIFAQVGTSDIVVYYLSERVNFKKQNIGLLIIEMGILNVFFQLVVLPQLAKRFSGLMITYSCLVALIIELVLIASIWAIWPVYAIIIPLVQYSLICAPILMAILTSSGSPTEQGLRLTGFQAVQDLCDALGPLVFGAIYGNVSSELSYVPFLVGAFMVIPAGVVAWYLPQYVEEEAEERRLNGGQHVLDHV